MTSFFYRFLAYLLYLLFVLFFTTLFGRLYKLFNYHNNAGDKALLNTRGFVGLLLCRHMICLPLSTRGFMLLIHVYTQLYCSYAHGPITHNDTKPSVLGGRSATQRESAWEAQSRLHHFPLLQLHTLAAPHDCFVGLTKQSTYNAVATF